MKLKYTYEFFHVYKGSATDEDKLDVDKKCMVIFCEVKYENQI